MVVSPYRAIATRLMPGEKILASNLPVSREILICGGNAPLVDPEDSGERAG